MHIRCPFKNAKELSTNTDLDTATPWHRHGCLRPAADLGGTLAMSIAAAWRKGLERQVAKVSSTQRARILTRAKMALQQRLHEEFSVWWREGKVPLPEYTARRVLWWDHKPPLPFELQLQSRSKDRVRIFDERFLYLQRIIKARRERRKAKAAEWTEERKKILQEREQKKKERQQKALEAVSGAKCGGLLGNLGYLLPDSKRRSLT
eukprot:s1271_g7.t1